MSIAPTREEMAHEEGRASSAEFYGKLLDHAAERIKNLEFEVAQRDNDIYILLATLDFVIEASGEALDDEGGDVAAIRKSLGERQASRAAVSANQREV